MKRSIRHNDILSKVGNRRSIRSSRMNAKSIDLWDIDLRNFLWLKLWIAVQKKMRERCSKEGPVDICVPRGCNVVYILTVGTKQFDRRYIGNIRLSNRENLGSFTEYPWATAEFALLILFYLETMLVNSSKTAFKS